MGISGRKVWTERRAIQGLCSLPLAHPRNREEPRVSAVEWRSVRVYKKRIKQVAEKGKFVSVDHKESQESL